jgi:hypothetical protein
MLMFAVSVTDWPALDGLRDEDSVNTGALRRS